MKKICGYDVNGWRDVAMRNWLLRPGEEIEIEGSFVIEGSIVPSVVQTGDIKSEKWIGGAQASVAPHGRGEGWGEVGRRDRRIEVRDCIYDKNVNENALIAIFSGLNREAQFGVAAIDDAPTTTETVQERLLKSLRKAKVSTRLLVWRPVLAALYGIEKDILDEGQTVGVICHSSQGFSIQRLKIRKEMGQGNVLLAPERKSAGVLVKSCWGYGDLLQKAKQAIVGDGQSQLDAHLMQAKAIGKLALGEPVNPEVLRKSNGDWEVIEPPTHLNLPTFDVGIGSLDAISKCDFVFLETLCSGKIRNELLDNFTKIISLPVELLPLNAIVESAFFAANRLSLRNPIYFDFLPQISTIVQTHDGASNFDLIDAEATVSAGELYRSTEPACFGIQSGQRSFSVYIRKENVPHPRKAIIPLGVELKETVPINLWVEQSPASGRAKLNMQSSEINRQFSVDWDTAEVIEDSWEHLIAELSDSYPTIPNRLVLPCGMQAWEQTERSEGLINALDQSLEDNLPNWKFLASQMSSRPFGYYPISSDGNLPDNVLQKYVNELDRLNDVALADLEERMAGAIDTNNDSLRFLTWQFRRCPDDVVSYLLSAVDADIKGHIHPLINHPMNLVLIYQGIGRVSKSQDIDRRVIELILERPISEWSYRRETACLAFLLSRTDAAPKLLTREDVELISKRICMEFDKEHGSDYTKFMYAPFLLVGLLRWRLSEPRALVAGQDSIASNMMERVESAITDFEFRGDRSFRFNQSANKYLPILKDTKLELQGEGSNSELLLDIYSA